MFIYATAWALKKQGINTCISSFSFLHYFKIPLYEKILNLLKWYYIRLVRKLQHVSNYNFKNGWENHSPQLIAVEGNAIVTGYFQGLHYFENIQDEIKQKFEVKKKYRNKFEDYITPYKKQKIIAVQIRRTDYQKFNDSDLMGPDLTLPLTYYNNNNLMEQKRKEDSYQFIIMGDDKQYLHDQFDGLPDVIISDNNEIIDLQILIHADVCIISPSSFGWWGAWLNEKTDKIVYVPEYYLGFKVNREYPIGIIPAAWNKVKIQT